MIPLHTGPAVLSVQIPPPTQRPSALPPAQAAQQGYVIKPATAQTPGNAANPVLPASTSQAGQVVASQLEPDEMPANIRGELPAGAETKVENEVKQKENEKAKLEEDFKENRKEIREKADMGFAMIKEGETRRIEQAKDFAAQTASDGYDNAHQTMSPPEPKELMAAA